MKISCNSIIFNEKASSSAAASSAAGSSSAAASSSSASGSAGAASSSDSGTMNSSKLDSRVYTDCEQNEAETIYSNERYNEENDTKINPRKSNNRDVRADFEQNKIETNDIDETNNEQNDSSLNPSKLENEDVPDEKEKEKDEGIKSTKNKRTNIIKKLESLPFAEGSLVDDATDIISTSYPRREVDETHLRLQSTLMVVRIYCIAF